MFDRNKVWQRLCTVDAKPLIKWMGAQKAWDQNPSGVDRVRKVPQELLSPIMERMWPCFGPERGKLAARDITINRIPPHFTHGMHYDGQGGTWLTRAHVPIVTSDQAWHRFEIDGIKVHFDVGSAYSFNTEARHDFGNDGDTERVHLVFDIYRVI